METKISKNENDVYLIELSGIMELSGSIELKEIILKTIGQKIEGIIISFKEVVSVNSSGIGALIFVSSTLKKLNCPLIIIMPDGPVLRALEVTRLTGYFNIVPTLKDALSCASSK